MSDDAEWVTVHDTAIANTNPDSMVHVTINTVPICSNMTNKQFAETVMRARDAGLTLIKDRIAAVAQWDANEQARAKTYFGRADDEIRSTLAARLPRLLAAMQELVPEKIVRWDDASNRNLTCSVVPDNGQNRAGVCKPDSEKRVIAIYSAFCTDSNGELWHGAKVKTLIHECTHFTDTFNSDDIMYGNTESGMHAFALGNRDKAIRNADSIAGYIATFDKTVAR
ncbi:lysine-specific metallo-endopeptidase family protein [Paraburkholderia sp. GV068]|jgi:Lysine-specific metallo-endopeptidase|uniref:M35 family metallo-endopeptidase n=1 Tax=Paraburkholderia TaxID=1822464 RepID=UPI000D31688D|nr:MULTISPECIES: M35 family metallo-endopeptidase [unclassified Paraburkholderia]PTQ97334.1 lysine-specific metallo-endopeptidase family protein [Paraburkholderia sp. GV072]PUB02873.1 lysine-specific metallo-endopeptidase family protein [Paraburkholderia sp. GV068]